MLPQDCTIAPHGPKELLQHAVWRGHIINSISLQSPGGRKTQDASFVSLQDTMGAYDPARTFCLSVRGRNSQDIKLLDSLTCLSASMRLSLSS